MSAITDAGGSVDIEETLTDREIRALTERLVVLNRDSPGLFTVFSEEGTDTRSTFTTAGRVPARTSSSTIPTVVVSTSMPRGSSPAIGRFPRG